LLDSHPLSVPIAFRILNHQHKTMSSAGTNFSLPSTAEASSPSKDESQKPVEEENSRAPAKKEDPEEVITAAQVFIELPLESPKTQVAMGLRIAACLNDQTITYDQRRTLQSLQKELWDMGKTGPTLDFDWKPVHSHHSRFESGTYGLASSIAGGRGAEDWKRTSWQQEQLPMRGLMESLTYTSHPTELKPSARIVPADSLDSAAEGGFFKGDRKEK
jgi:hypothetical protein